MTDALQWLLEDDNPAVRCRAQTELLGTPGDRTAAAAWAYHALPESWQDAGGLWFRYYISALAECGLRREDVPSGAIQKALAELDDAYDASCADFMLLRALVMLGLIDEPAVYKRLDAMGEAALPDGGYLCRHRLDKLKYTPKSCYKANLHALMLLSECKKQGVPIKGRDGVIEYFLDRRLFYRHDDPTALVLDGREGWRTVDTFYPFEAMRVGLQNVVESLCALGYGQDERLEPAWTMLGALTNEHGFVTLKGTLTKSWLPRERVGRPSKWVTLYALLAQKHVNPQAFCPD